MAPISLKISLVTCTPARNPTIYRIDFQITNPQNCISTFLFPADFPLNKPMSTLSAHHVLPFDISRKISIFYYFKFLVNCCLSLSAYWLNSLLFSRVVFVNSLLCYVIVIAMVLWCYSGHGFVMSQIRGAHMCLDIFPTCWQNQSILDPKALFSSNRSQDIQNDS